MRGHHEGNVRYGAACESREALVRPVGVNVDDVRLPSQDVQIQTGEEWVVQVVRKGHGAVAVDWDAIGRDGSPRHVGGKPGPGDLCEEVAGEDLGVHPFGPLAEGHLAHVALHSSGAGRVPGGDMKDPHD
ncbi:MAG: hypothetical protein M1143_02480 [Candidatus Thermoplasmatota archaeon]|nr:hypothetical protein [Candidatus Thermoplasmatota archaeon]